MVATTTPQLNTLEEALEAAVSDREKVDALNALAREVADNDPERARPLAARAHSLAVALGYGPGLARSLHTQGHAHYRLGEGEEARELYCRALEVSRREGDRAVEDRAVEDRAVEADCLHGLGVLAKLRAEHAAAVSYYLEALRLYEALDDPAGQAQTLNGLGNAHMGREDLGRALPCYLDSLKRREALGDETGVGCSLNNIANVYAALGDNAQALDHYRRCLELSRQTGATRLEARCLANLSEIHIALGRPDEALENSRAAHAIALRYGYRSGVTSATP